MASFQALARRSAHRARTLAGRFFSPLPAAGFTDNRLDAPFVERLSDHDLQRLNRLLPWSCFTVDGRGRRFGAAAWSGKRQEAQAVPDRRIVLLDERVPLHGKHVLEFGCFEGVHTIALAQRAARVTAVDARVDNVVKTVVRCAFHGCHPDVFVCEVETPGAMASLEPLRPDVVHHVGVLYHLRDPVRHVLDLGRIAQGTVFLDTHVAAPADATDTFVSQGELFPCRRYKEGGRTEVFSGMYDHANWLTLSSLTDLLHRAGFTTVDLLEERAERNGPRVMILASR